MRTRPHESDAPFESFETLHLRRGRKGTRASAMSFLDPYSKNRKLPLIWIGRLALLVLVVGLYFLGRWIWETMGWG